MCITAVLFINIYYHYYVNGMLVILPTTYLYSHGMCAEEIGMATLQ